MLKEPLGTSSGGSDVGNMLRELQVEDPICCWEHVEGNFKWRIRRWEHVEGTSSGESNVGNMLRELFKWRIQCWEDVEDPLGTSSGGSNVGNIWRTH
jgi:hypothetical protein